MEACEPFQEISVASFRFRAFIPLNELLFDYEAEVGVIWLENMPVLNVVNSKTGFQNGINIHGKSAENI